MIIAKDEQEGSSMIKALVSMVFQRVGNTSHEDSVILQFSEVFRNTMVKSIKYSFQNKIKMLQLLFSITKKRIKYQVGLLGSSVNTF
jgi:hypothetical protein